MTITLTKAEYKNLRYALMTATQAALANGRKEQADELLDIYENLIKQSWTQEE